MRQSYKFILVILAILTLTYIFGSIYAEENVVIEENSTWDSDTYYGESENFYFDIKSGERDIITDVYIDMKDKNTYVESNVEFTSDKETLIISLDQSPYGTAQQSYDIKKSSVKNIIIIDQDGNIETIEK